MRLECLAREYWFGMFGTDRVVFVLLVEKGEGLIRRGVCKMMEEYVESIDIQEKAIHPTVWFRLALALSR